MRQTPTYALVLVRLSGCISLGGSSAEATAHAQLEALWKGDADAVVATFADRYFDFGSGRWIEKPESNIRSTMADPDFRDQMASLDSWRELVNLNGVISGRPSDLGEAGQFFQDPAFESQTGDIVWYAPPIEGSPLNDGWGGLYREFNGRWQIVGGD